MYLSHFGVQQSPFDIAPDPGFFYAGCSRGEILEALIYAVCHGEGIAMVTGEAGSGNTMLCRMLENMLSAGADVICLSNPALARDDVAAAIAGQLGIATSGRRPEETLRLVQGQLHARHAAGRQVVLLVEEAQAMPLGSLEEIRALADLEGAGRKLLQVVLFGQPKLEKSLGLPHMRQLKRGINRSFKLPPLPVETLPEFLMFRMRAAGYRGPDVFSKDAIQLMASVSQGILRRVVLLADRALAAAFAANSREILPQHVKAAIQDNDLLIPALAKFRRNAIAATAMFAGLVAAAAASWHLRPSTEMAPAVSAPSVVVPAPAPPPAAAPVPVAAAMQATPPSLAAPTAVRETPAAVSPLSTEAPAASASLLQQRLAATRALLRDLGEDRRYTIQIALMSTGDGAQVERFLQKAEQNIGMEKLYVYPTKIGNSTRYGIVYDSIASREQTMETIANLSKQFGYRPQLRTFTGIREEIERSKTESLWGGWKAQKSAISMVSR